MADLAKHFSVAVEENILGYDLIKTISKNPESVMQALQDLPEAKLAAILMVPGMVRQLHQRGQTQNLHDLVAKLPEEPFEPPAYLKVEKSYHEAATIVAGLETSASEADIDAAIETLKNATPAAGETQADVGDKVYAAIKKQQKLVTWEDIMKERAPLPPPKPTENSPENAEAPEDPAPPLN